MTLSNDAGTLYVVATPIGNLADFSDRGRSVLQSVALIAAEDTRHTQKLLAHFGLNTPLLSLHEHNEADRVQVIIQRLQQGQDLALVSDAGTPLISDPGFVLVRAVREAGFRVSPVPGPSAMLAALSVSGLPTDRFVFEGFLPARQSARRSRLEALEGETRTLVFYEAGRRMAEMLEDLRQVFGAGRRACICRELTKRFETVVDGSLDRLCDWLVASPDHQRGEFVVLLAGADTAPSADDRQLRLLLEHLCPEIGVKRASALAAKICGVGKGEAYRLALELGRD